MIEALPTTTASALLEELPPTSSVRILGYLDADRRRAALASLDAQIRDELESIMTYPANTAGRYMDPGVPTYRRSVTARQALKQLRGRRDENCPKSVPGRRQPGTDRQGLAAIARVGRTIGDPSGNWKEPVSAVLRPVDPLEEVTAAFETTKVLDIPIVNVDGVFLGAITHDFMAESIQRESVAGYAGDGRRQP